jgi:hypothetical protein
MDMGTSQARKPAAPALALVLALLATLVCAARAEAVPAKFWGVVPQSSFTTDEYQRLGRGGVDSMRVAFDWGTMQPNRDEPVSFEITDLVVEKASAAGIEVLPTLTGAPEWAVPQKRVPGGHGAEAPAHLPVRGTALAGWRNLIKEVIRRYGPQGTFWSEHPTMVKRPIRFWQVWNEPNFAYFVAKPNAAEYGKLVKFSYGAARGVDKGARLVLAGLFGEPKNCRRQKRPLNPCADDFIDQMYRRTPGIKKRFVGVSVHPYTGSWQGLKPQVEDIRAILKENRDAGKGLWLTEIGWSSQKPDPKRNVFAKGVNGQRNQLKGAFRLLESKQRAWRIKRVYWFSIEDLADSCNFCDGSGLFADGFKPKKAWYAYVQFAGGKP